MSDNQEGGIGASTPAFAFLRVPSPLATFAIGFFAWKYGREGTKGAKGREENRWGWSIEAAMELASSLSNLSQANTMSKVQIAVAKKMMDNQKMQGQAALELLNAA